MSKYSTLTIVLIVWGALLNRYACQISQNSGPVHACAPANISFAAPAGATSITWNFGTFGSFTSASGAFNVVNPASFVASFSGIVNGSNLTFTVPVTVHAKPAANFSLTQPSSECVVKTVTLTDQSTTSNTIVSYLWTYGDGGSGNAGGTHTYGYTLPGTYSVTLKVVDSYGCDNQITKGPVNVTSPPSAIISSNPPALNSCSTSLVAAFSASNSSGTGALTYNWNFGNGQTSQAVSPPAVTYTSQANSYVVSLTVTANGCKAVANSFVNVSPPTLTASVPSTVCLGASPVVTLQSNQFVSSWDLGNSNVVNVMTPGAGAPTVALPAYSSAGQYTISVNAGTGQCTITPQYFTVVVEQVNAHYTSGAPYTTCSHTKIVGFNNQSTGNIVQYQWSYTDFSGSLVTSTVTNPTFTFTTYDTDPYTYTSTPYNPTVTLIATSAAGCKDTFSIAQHTINPPVAWFYKDKREGCVPLAVKFNDTSLAFPPHPVTSYTWHNGAAPPVTVVGNTFPIPSHVFTYTATGLYEPYLVVETLGGCIDTSFVDTVIVVDPPVVSFSFSPSQVCPGQAVQIVNTSPNISSIQHWHVESDNGFFSGCVTDANPSWQFTNVGLHTFTMSGYYHSCKGTAVSSQSVLVQGPIVQSRYETNCTSPLNVVFHNTLQEVQTATIDFGDNTSTVVAGNATGIVTNSVAHTYTASGDYVVTVTGVNAGTGCAPHVYTLQAQVREIKAEFTGPALACIGTAPQFNAQSSDDVYATCNRGYTWYVDNLPPEDISSPFYSHNFTNYGTHTVTLVVRDVNSCQDRVSHTITVSDVTPTFSFSSNNICFSSPTVQIINTTQPVPDPISSFFWDFGNGYSLTTTQQTVPVQSYSAVNQPSVYTVLLNATNSKGCSKFVTHTVQVINPDASFYASSPGMCLPANTATTITFVAQHAYPSYTFDYGVSPTSTAVVNFSVSSYTFMAGNYTVSMTVKDNQGCTNTGIAIISNVQVPVADFIFSSPGSTGGNNICSPAVVSFSNVSFPPPSIPTWDMGTGSPVLPLNVVTFPYSSTTSSVIAISLSVSSGPPYNCKSSVTKNFTVYVAKAEIVVSKTLICVGDEIRFSIDSTGGGGVKSWVWDFGDATASPTVQASSGPPSFTMHTYNNYTATAEGNTSASLIYWSSGDACKYSSEQQIKIINVQPGLLRNNELTVTDSLHCLNIADRFVSKSVSNSDNPLLFNWQLPGGISGSDSVITHVFPNHGVQQVSLTVTDSGHNCKASTVKNLTIFPLPTATIASGQHCPEIPFTLTVTASPAVVSGTWNPPAGIMGPNVFTTSSQVIFSEAVAAASMEFSLNVQDTNACVSETIVRDIEILLPPPRADWDTSIVIGERITVNGYVGNYTYTWTPEIAQLSCTLCPSPVSTSTNDITYTVVVEDHMKCAQVQNTYKITILPKASVDVPTAFTPNGDGKNDIIYVDGWGIKKLNYFRIYNRWGQLLFETNDINQGWDGNYRGVPQNNETYVYEVSVQSYISDEPILKSSTFKILR